MKVIIHPNEAPIIYDDLGKRIEGIYNFDYHYVTDTDNPDPDGVNSMSLSYWSDDYTNCPSLLHQGWDKNPYLNGKCSCFQDGGIMNHGQR